MVNTGYPGKNGYGDNNETGSNAKGSGGFSENPKKTNIGLSPYPLKDTGQEISQIRDQIKSAAEEEQARRTNDVRALQSYLRTISFVYPEVPRITIDGIPGPETTAAIEAFQQLMGLEQTGIIDDNTWTDLLTVYHQVLGDNGAMRSIQPFPRQDYITQEGENSFLVSQIQLLLAFLSTIFSNFTDQDISGILDESTINNIKEFQKRAGLPVTGNVDKATWDSMALAFNNILHPNLKTEEWSQR